ncbi:LysE family translocator [Aestuariibacter salexigens]|uniref:LysE family translocator n=1 Tax=Aestuariibacter salexigens TaxID=226010 RepID=UPI0004238588|nr:LysE family translocator [Aestuariibacter salexigens]
MFSTEAYLTFLTAVIVLALSPGPSNLYIMARSMAQGRQAGYAAASGMAAGSILYVVLTALGLSTIIAYSPLAYTALQLCGAVYLIYLGFQYFRQAPLHQPCASAQVSQPTYKLLKQSFVVELTNPKTALFFLAFLPQFVNPEGHLGVQLMALGLTYTIVGFISDLMVATLSGKLGRWLAHHPWFERWQDRLSGSILIGLGSYLVIQHYTER